MIRRSFRIGLTLGLLGGLGWALAKMFGPRRSAPAPALSSPAPWPALTSDEPAPSRSAHLLATPPIVTPDAPQAPPVTAPTAPASASPTPTAPAEPAPKARSRKTPPTASIAAKPANAKATVAQPAVAKAAPSPAAPSKAAPVKTASPAKAKASTKKKPLVAAWVVPEGDVCPTSHPVKGKVASKIFHLPGMLNYARTRPDRCYRDAAAAEADGLRAAKR